MSVPILFYTSRCSTYPNAQPEEIARCTAWWDSLTEKQRFNASCIILKVDTREIWFEWKVFGLWNALGQPKYDLWSVKKDLSPLFQVCLQFSDHRQSTLYRLSE